MNATVDNMARLIAFVFFLLSMGAFFIVMTNVFRRRWEEPSGHTFARIPPLHLSHTAAGLALIVFSAVALIDMRYAFSVGAVLASFVGCSIAGKNPVEALRLNRPNLRQVSLIPLVAYFATMPMLIGGSMISQGVCRMAGVPFEPQALLQFFWTLKTPRDIFFFFVMASVVAPMAEEIFFRGYLYPWFQSFLPRWGAAVACSFLFALVHLHLPVFLPLFILSTALLLVYEYSGSLWSSIIFHSFFNTMTLMLALFAPKLLKS